MPSDVVAFTSDLTLSEIDNNQKEFAIDRIIIHPLHNEVTSRYDFALLHLAGLLIS